MDELSILLLSETSLIKLNTQSKEEKDSKTTLDTSGLSLLEQKLSERVSHPE